MPAWHVGVILASVLVGSVLQGVVGLGVGLVVTPVTALVEPALVPGLPLLVVVVYPLLTVPRNLRGIDWRGLAWALSARVPGTVVGVLVVAWASDRVIGVAVALMVLLAVALSVRAVVVPVRPSTLMGAGFVSGITGTSTSIGGPPLALLYQGREPEVVRGTLGVYFVAGATLSIAGLAPAGGFTATDVALGLLALPVLVVGAGLSALADRRVEAAQMRTATLVLCALTALVLLARSLFG